MRNGKDKDKLIYYSKDNYEEEIKKCEIKINDELILFNYFYNFKSKRKYKIKYIFKNNIEKLCLLFSDCESIITIDLSNFNTNNVTNMSNMFPGCKSLKKENIITKDKRILNIYDESMKY